MANKARGEVVLDLGERQFLLRPSFGAVCEIEDALGASLFELGRKLEEARISARELVKFAHACATLSGEEIEPARLGEMIVARGAHKTVVTLVEYCRNYAFGGREEKKASVPLGAPPPTEKPNEAATTSGPA